MKLTKLHLFMLLLIVLLLSTLGIGVLEGMGVIEGNENISSSSTSLANIKSDKAGVVNSALSDGNSYNPFSTNEVAGMSNEEIKNSRSIHPNVKVRFKKMGNEKRSIGFGSADGITRDQIPDGQEHLYVLKSEIVPPVCPKCPEPPKQSSKGNGGGNCCKKKECPPCPRPQRCPEPAFTCKKVPNYEASAVDNVLPSPMFKSDGKSGGMEAYKPGDPMARLNSFSKF